MTSRIEFSDLTGMRPIIWTLQPVETRVHRQPDD